MVTAMFFASFSARRLAAMFLSKIRFSMMASSSLVDRLYSCVWSSPQNFFKCRILCQYKVSTFGNIPSTQIRFFLKRNKKQNDRDRITCSDRRAKNIFLPRKTIHHWHRIIKRHTHLNADHGQWFTNANTIVHNLKQNALHYHLWPWKCALFGAGHF